MILLLGTLDGGQKLVDRAVPHLSDSGAVATCWRAMKATEQWQPGVRPWLIALTIILPTFVANVALPHIAGSFSASIDEATWVLTSYLKASSRRGAGEKSCAGPIPAR